MCNAPLERNRIVFGTAGRFAAAAGIAAFAVLDDFGGARESANFAHARDVAPIAFNAEHEVWIRIEPVLVYGELSHRVSR